MIATWLRISHALVMPRRDGLLFQDLNVTVMESASEHLSSLNTSLGVPLNPTFDMGFWAKIGGDATRAGPFQGASLVACIVVEIAQSSWSDPENVPVAAPKTERRCKDMLFTFQPALLPGAEFTTYKAGMALILLLRDLFGHSLWPLGHITVEIAKYDTARAAHPWGLPIGLISIEKLAPGVGAMNNLTVSEGNDDSTPLTLSKSDSSKHISARDNTNDGLMADAKDVRERKWLGGYVRLIIYIFAKAALSRVQQILPVGPHMYPMVLRLKSEFDAEMEANLTIIRDPGEIVWLSVLGAAVTMCETARANDRWDYQDAIYVSLHDRPSLKLSIGPTWSEPSG